MPCSKEAALDLLLRAQSDGRLAHAHLFTGTAGSGKRWLVEHLAGAVLHCPPRSVPTHPDAHFVQPESKSRRIVIEQIRSLEAVIQRKPLLSSWKVAVIHDADRLQPAAANAFLKTLEEPPPGSIIMLTSTLPEAILETILSRCVETSLHGGDTGPDARGHRLLDALDACLADNSGGVAPAFRLTRTIQELLVEVRESVAGEYAVLLKEESKKYKDRSGADDWLDEREDQLKAMSESATLRERERLVGCLLYALGGALRVSHGGDATHPVCHTLARRFTTTELLARVEAWETMQRRLAMNVNEALTLEAGLLEFMIGHHHSL